jgi:hypothetical protein
MGFPPRLDGKHTPLPSDEMETCPNCHRKFPIYDLVIKGGNVKRECPYCDYEFISRLNRPMSKSTSKEGHGNE